MHCKTQKPDSARLCLCSLPYPLIDDQIKLTDNERGKKNVRLGLERWLSG